MRHLLTALNIRCKYIGISGPALILKALHPLGHGMDYLQALCPFHD
jgi:hypothetical protein